jgi:hypothetical protein
MLGLRELASIKAGLLFLIIGSPFMYKLTQKLLGGLFQISSKGCPTTAGLLLHAVVIGLITYFLMTLCNEGFENSDEQVEEGFEDEMEEGFEDGMEEGFEDSGETLEEGFEDEIEEGFENARVYKRRY